MAELIKLDPGAIKKAEWIDERDALIKSLVRVRNVNSDDELKSAGRLQTEASKHILALEKIRKQVKQPAIDFGREVDNQAKELRAELEMQISRVKELNGEYATKIAREAEDERRRIAEAEAARTAREAEEAAKANPVTFGGLQAPTTAPQPEPDFVGSNGAAVPIPTGKVSTGANAMVTVWDYDIINPKDVPRAFLSVDEKKIRAYLKYQTTDGGTPDDVPGVRFTSRVDVRAR